MSEKKKKKKENPQVHPDLKGFNIWVNEQGEIESTYSVEELNKFLNTKVVDKKLKDRFDLDVKREEE
ncbi:MAG: hypothetical protein OHK0038_04250 [Flammeovirgaceae bacterium]